MTDKVEHSLQNQNFCLHLEIKLNLLIGDDIISYTKPKWGRLDHVTSSQCSTISQRWPWGRLD